jgi:hypothetical protein
LTGVDPSNFPKALTTLATFALVPSSIFIIAMVAGLTSLWYMVAAGITMLWYEIQTFWQQVRLISGLSLAQKKVLRRIDRIFMKGFGAFGVLAFCGLLVSGEVSPVNRAVRFIAVTTLVATEFSYDHTCPVSSQKRLVARLKDFSESKPPKVLIAEQRAWGDVNFSIGTCE